MSTESQPEQQTTRSPRSWALLISVIVVVIALIIGVVLWAFPVFAVRSIEVSGQEATSQEEVIAASGLSDGENLLRINTTAAAAGIVGLPWVDQATVARQLPSTVQVKITEHVPVGYVDSAEGSVLINERGEAFVVAEPPPGAVHITGAATENEDVMAGAVEISSALPDVHRELVASIDAAAEHSYTLQLHDGRRIVWGDSVDNENKAVAFEVVINREGSEWNISNPTSVTVR